ncbi:aminotransferase class I/II-fold pyridoxal phosphate-dependent enzyme [Sulfurimonas sp.]
MKHGANIYKYAKKLGCLAEEIIDFSSNINLYQPTQALSLTSTSVSRYAQSSYCELKKIIAKNYSINSNQIALYNGATAAIYALISSLKRKDVFLYAPLYGEYEKACKQAKKNIYKINRLSDKMQKPTKNSIVIFVNPSTPEGKYRDMAALLKMWMQKDCLIIIDESFLEFEELTSCREKIQEYKKLYIIQSFSKFYSCAGVRIGAIFSHKKSIKKLHQPLWNLSSFDVAFLQERLQDKRFKKKSLKLHKKQKTQLKSILKKSGLFQEIVPSDGNFILTYSTYAKEIFKHLLTHKILVRKCGSFEYLDDNYLRFAIKSKEHQKHLKKALSTVLVKQNNV